MILYIIIENIYKFIFQEFNFITDIYALQNR